MVSLLEKEIEKIKASGKVEPNFIVVAVDFFRTYADRYHHGKEEGILFKGLSSKKLSDIDHKMMLELVMEHAFARKTVKSLEALKENYVDGKTETLSSILDLLRALVELYPKHICKEDAQFFYPSMKYFTQEEQERMLNDFIEFDRNFTNKKYSQIVESLSS
jgi:hemerythrin-like domain-containing protein